MKFIAALINLSLQPARSNTGGFMRASDAALSPTSPLSVQQSQYDSAQGSTVNSAISTDNGNSDSRQSDVIEAETSSDSRQSNVIEAETSSDSRQSNVIEAVTSSVSWQQSLKTDLSQETVETKNSEYEQSVISGKDNSEVISSFDGEKHLNMLSEPVRGIDGGSQIGNQISEGSKENVPSYDIHNSQKDFLENNLQIDPVFEGIDKNVDFNTGLTQKTDTTNLENISKKQSVNHVNDASPMVQSEYVETSNAQNDLSKDVNRQALNSEVEHTTAKQAEPIRSRKVSSNQFLPQPRIFPSEIKSVKRPERREPPQVKIGHINVLIDDQATGKPTRSVAKSASRPSNPFGLRGL